MFNQLSKRAKDAHEKSEDILNLCSNKRDYATMQDKIETNLLLRALRSLLWVYVDEKSLDVLLKLVTFVNLLKKFVSSKFPLTPWIFHDCVAKFHFYGETNSFCLVKGMDFNIYLNPYFHEYDIAQFVFSLSPGDIFLDVGAHGGLYTLIAAKKVGPKGKVIAFEPNPLNLNSLRMNIKLNRPYA